MTSDLTPQNPTRLESKSQMKQRSMRDERRGRVKKVKKHQDLMTSVLDTLYAPRSTASRAEPKTGSGRTAGPSQSMVSFSTDTPSRPCVLPKTPITLATVHDSHYIPGAPETGSLPERPAVDRAAAELLLFFVLHAFKT